MQVREGTSADTFPLTRLAGAQKILFTPAVWSRVHEYTLRFDRSRLVELWQIKEEVCGAGFGRAFVLWPFGVATKKDVKRTRKLF